jgi:hypothetical protein
VIQHIAGAVKEGLLQGLFVNVLAARDAWVRPAVRETGQRVVMIGIDNVSAPRVQK